MTRGYETRLGEDNISFSVLQPSQLRKDVQKIYKKKGWESIWKKINPVE